MIPWGSNSRKPKVSEFDVEVFVKEDVLRFDIPVSVSAGVNEINYIYKLSKVMSRKIFREQRRSKGNIVK